MRLTRRVGYLFDPDGRQKLALGASFRVRHWSWAVLRHLPASRRETLWDAVNKAMLRIGWGNVVPAQEFEQFLVAELCALRQDSDGSPLEGDYLEFGVYLGTSMTAAVRAFERAGIDRSRFIGFDS